MKSSDATRRARPGPWPPAGDEKPATMASSWAKRTGFKSRLSGETNASGTDSVKILAVKPRELEVQPDLETGVARVPPASSTANGAPENERMHAPNAGDLAGSVPPERKKRETDGASKNARPNGQVLPRPSREELEPVTHSHDEEGFIQRHSRMKYELRDTPGLVPIGLYGVQHYISIVGSLILIPLVIVPAMGGTHEDTSMVVSTVFFVSGVTTLLHTFLGSRLPLIQGPSFVYLAPALVIINSSEFLKLNGNNFKHIMKELQGAIIISSAFQAILGYSGLMSLFLRLINPVVVTPTIAAVGLSFFSYGFPQVGNCLEIGIPQILLVIIFSLYLRKISIFGHRIFQVYAVPLAVAITWAYAFLLTEAGVYTYKGCEINIPASNIVSTDCRKHVLRMKHCRVDTSHALKASPWFRLPFPLQWGLPIFHWKFALVMCAVSIIATVDSDIYSTMPRVRDVAWEHMTSVAGSTSRVRCNYCHKEMSGGATRMKEHLLGQKGEVAACTRIPRATQDHIRSEVDKSKAKAKAKARRDAQFLEDELDSSHQRTFGEQRPHHVPASDHSDSDPEMAAALRASRIDAQQAEDRRRSSAGGAGPSGPSLRRSYTTREGGPAVPRDPRQPTLRETWTDRPRGGSQRVPPPSISSCDPSPDSFAHRPKSATQSKLKAIFGKKTREKLGRAVAKFFLYSHIPPSVADSNPYYQPMLDIAAEAVGHTKGPTGYEISEKYLRAELEEIQQYVDSFRPFWGDSGCTIMADGWTGPTSRPLINFLIYSTRGTVFHRSVDTSGHVKDADYLFRLFDQVVDEVGEENVVQFVTDNEPSYKAAGRKLMEKREHLFWSPCAAHCIDLILERIGKKKNIQKIVANARMITTFIYNYSQLVALMRKYTNNHELLRPGITRFATNFIALESLYRHRGALGEMFASTEWRHSRIASSSRHTGAVLEVPKLVLDNSFWTKVKGVMSIMEPLIKVLKLVDGDEKPTMGFLYEAMMRARTEIEAASTHPQQYLEIIDERWARQLHHDLHAAGYFLNPRFHYQEGFEFSDNIRSGVTKVIERLAPNVTFAIEATREVKNPNIFEDTKDSGDGAVPKSRATQVGSYHATSVLVASRPPTPGVVSRGIGLEGVSGVLSGLWGTGTGSTTLTENVHTIAVSKMGSRRCVELGALLLIILSLIGKVGGFIASIPDVMVAALLCFMWAMLAALGLSNLRYSEAGSSRNVIIVGLSLFLSLSVPAYFQQYGVVPNANSSVPSYFQPYIVASHGPFRSKNDGVNYVINTLLSFHMVIAFLVAVILDNTVPGSRQERGVYDWSRAETARREPAVAKDYELPFRVGRVFRWVKWVGL